VLLGSGIGGSLLIGRLRRRFQPTSWPITGAPVLERSVEAFHIADDVGAWRAGGHDDYLRSAWVRLRRNAELQGFWQSQRSRS
jgi:hypothetical protein